MNTSKFSTGILLCIATSAWGQKVAQTASIASAPLNEYDISAPQVLPASPEPSAFVKAGLGNVNMSTGAVTAKIPLYEIKIRDYTFPIFLSYSTQGLKVDEVSSRAGYGWVLNASGMITRSVRGQPDELTSWLPIPSEFPENSDAVVNYCINAGDPNLPGYDTQPDEFQFNVNGYSGKFVLDTNKVARVTSQQNIKVTTKAVGIAPIVLITPDGVKYTFGTSEITTTHTIQQFSYYKTSTTTAFFLDKIELPTGEYIQFTYNTIHIKAALGHMETLTKTLSSVVEASCEITCPGENFSSQTNSVEYDTKYLTGITTSNGLNISLGYQTRPDLSNDNRLASFVVSGLKNFSFEYYDRVPTNVTSGRFFLTKVRELGTDENADTSHNYVLTYDHMEETPLPNTYEQDYLGYYNGSGWNRLLPAGFNSDNTINLTFRNPDWNYAKKGTLRSIQYPTGGWEFFNYEANTTGKNQWIKRNTTVSPELQGNGGGSTGTIYDMLIGNIQRNQTATLSGYVADAILDDGYTPYEMAKTAYLYLYDVTNNNTLVSSKTILGLGSAEGPVSLVAGHNYRLELKVMAATERGYAMLTYDTASQDIFDSTYIETVVPGVRVKQIKYVDPITFSTHSKYYTYESLNEPGVSTGTCANPIFAAYASVKNYCDGMPGRYTICNELTYSSNTTQDVYNYAGSGSVMYYKTVIESDDPDFRNGGTEYTFYDNDNGANYQLLLGQTVPYPPAGQYPTLSGVVKLTRQFDTNKQIVQEEQDDYETMIDMTNTVRSMYVRRRYTPRVEDQDRMNAFDVLRILYSSYWIRLKTKTVKTYSASGILTQQENYTYGMSSNILPAAIATTDSKGLALKTEKKYPTDYPADANYRKLTNKNVITPVVLQSSFVSDTLYQQKKVVYKDWFGDSTIMAPEVVQVKESPADVLHNALIFSKYDRTGNPLLLQKADDVPLVYLWDTVHAVPVCEVRNAVLDQVAFSNFESPLNYGNWQVSSGTVGSDFNAFSGIQTFSGTLTRGIAVAGIYKVSVWSKSTVTVNGVAGTLTKSKRGWNLYEWSITNPSVITVQGTNMDDIRLHPVTALVSSYTYQPFIGITSHVDSRNSISIFEYDGYGRLTTVRDEDNNITKSYSYVYAGSLKPVYLNIEKYQIFTRACTGGMIGGTVKYTVYADTYASTISQVDADQKAQNDIDANGQNYANIYGTCSMPVTITCDNWTGLSDWKVKYTNLSSGNTTTFYISAASGVQTLGVLPQGNYNITVTKTNVSAISYSISSCSSNYQFGTTVTFNNIAVSPTNCNKIVIDLP